MRGLTFFVVFALILSTGCAGLTEQEVADFTVQCEKDTTNPLLVKACVKEHVKEEVSYRTGVRNAEHYDEYRMFKSMCDASGGHIKIDRHMLSRACMTGQKECPPRWDENYHCDHGY